MESEKLDKRVTHDRKKFSKLPVKNWETRGGRERSGGSKESKNQSGFAGGQILDVFSQCGFANPYYDAPRFDDLES